MTSNTVEKEGLDMFMSLVLFIAVALLGCGIVAVLFETAIVVVKKRSVSRNSTGQK
jgi:hypothetical protein